MQRGVPAQISAQFTYVLYFRIDPDARLNFASMVWQLSPALLLYVETHVPVGAVVLVVEVDPPGRTHGVSALNNDKGKQRAY